MYMLRNIRTRQLWNVRRYSSTTSAPSSALAEWMKSLTSAPATVETDVLDLHRCRQLASTLPTRNSQAEVLLGRDLKAGSRLPRGWSLIYFQPDCGMEALGLDGSWTTYNAPEPYTRRMWASGSFHFPSSSTTPHSATTASNSSQGPKIGQTIRQCTRVSKVDFKKDMVFVEVEKRWYSQPEKGTATEGQDGEIDHLLRETRCHVFRRQVGAANSIITPPPKSTKTSFTLPASPSASFEYLPTSPLLFRFSSLTFNAHRIHYDRTWAVDVEGQRGVVVHGPLTCLMLLELIESAVIRLNEAVEGKVQRYEGEKRWEIESFAYRATAPMVVDEEISMGVKWDNPDERGHRTCTAWATQNGVLGMSATAIVRKYGHSGTASA